MVDDWLSAYSIKVPYLTLSISKLINLHISVLFFLSLIFLIYHFLRIVCLARASSGVLYSVLTDSKAMLIHTQNLIYNYVEFPIFPRENS